MFAHPALFYVIRLLPLVSFLVACGPVRVYEAGPGYPYSYPFAYVSERGYVSRPMEVNRVVMVPHHIVLDDRHQQHHHERNGLPHFNDRNGNDDRNQRRRMDH